MAGTRHDQEERPLRRQMAVLLSAASAQDSSLLHRKSGGWAMTQTPIVPPFTLETATRKVQMAEDAWNSRDPERVALAYSPDSEWRNRTEFLRGREEIK